MSQFGNINFLIVVNEGFALEIRTAPPSGSGGALSADSWTSPPLENEVEHEIKLHYQNIFIAHDLLDPIEVDV